MSNPPLPFPLWMSAVSEEAMHISNRFNAMGMVAPPIPPLGQAAYALFGGIDPSLAAVLIMRDAMQMQAGFPR